jgi:hypothetical protein
MTNIAVIILLETLAGKYIGYRGSLVSKSK